MNDLITAITTLGFPTTLAVYLLFRFEKKIDNMVEISRGKDGILDKIEQVLAMIDKCCKGHR